MTVDRKSSSPCTLQCVPITSGEGLLASVRLRSVLHRCAGCCECAAWFYKCNYECSPCLRSQGCLGDRLLQNGRRQMV